MLHDYDASGTNKPRRQYFRRYFAESFHVVRRVGEHDVETPRTVCDEPQGIATHEGEVISTKLVGYFLDETLLCGSAFDSRHAAAFP